MTNTVVHVGQAGHLPGWEEVKIMCKKGQMKEKNGGSSLHFTGQNIYIGTGIYKNAAAAWFNASG